MKTEVCTVSRVLDGDTLECETGRRVRLIGMDTPEMSQRPEGPRARAALATWAPVGSRVLLELDVGPTDRYARTLAYVWSGDTLVNWALVRAGQAVLYTVPPNVRYVDALTAAQDQARGDGVGLWADPEGLCLPVDRRRGKC